ncbi:C40 family peptidase [Lysinibacillus pakistanensis]|uniref:SH3 domain-containing protein n=1 Tax=Lysinibacillus pakistanensis TaxID=759811 RepID=A0ABX6DC42_9BACI|nr:SH3 domain-containing protein [Lysinibacillus pakistanensis]
MNAIVTAMIANLHAIPQEESELVDEVLNGMPVKIIANIDANWVRVQTTYRYEGFCQKKYLIMDEEKTNTWLQEANHFIIQSFADILQYPQIQSNKIMTLVKGSIVRFLVSKGDDSEWVSVQIASGEIGYARRKWLQPKIAKNRLPDSQFRENVVQTALSYLNAPYRWGGKSPLGIDCSGLCSMVYMLHGVLIYRDAKIVDGFPIKQIPFEHLQKGDLLYFPGHMALYMGDSLYIHSSLGGGEVSINSLDSKHPLYRKDLAVSTLTAVGSIFI